MKAIVIWGADGGLLSQAFDTEDDAADFSKTLAGLSVVVSVDDGDLSCWGMMDGVYPVGGFGGVL